MFRISFVYAPNNHLLSLSLIRQRRSLVRMSVSLFDDMRNRMDEMHLEIVHSLVRNNSVVVLPPFGGKEMSSLSHRNISRASVKTLRSFGHYRFRQLLLQKGAEHGCRIVLLSEVCN